MTPLLITLPHRLSKAEAVQRLKTGLASPDRFGNLLTVQEQIWSGDDCSFRIKAAGQSVTGAIHVSEKDVKLEIALPWLLGKIAEKISGAIKTQARLLLDKK
jgi:hypothetical protein